MHGISYVRDRGECFLNIVRFSVNSNIIVPGRCTVFVFQTVTDMTGNAVSAHSIRGVRITSRFFGL
jgi:hypothetical protein